MCLRKVYGGYKLVSKHYQHPMQGIIVFIIFVVFGNKLFATAQFPDILIEGTDTTWITCNPLEVYFEQKGARKIGSLDLDSGDHCTALWRGYVATWRLENDSLFLIRIQTDYCGTPTEVSLMTEFGTNRVFASWLNSQIVRPVGELLHYIHMGYMSIYEADKYYSFTNGILQETKTESYLERNSSLIFPGEYYLSDTIRSLILKNIDSDERDKLPDFGSCRIRIEFDEKGYIKNIGFGNQENLNSIELLVLTTTQDAVKNFPQLMKVKHPQYQPPIIELFFSAHCLKNPYNRDYGCKYE